MVGMDFAGGRIAVADRGQPAGAVIDTVAVFASAKLQRDCSDEQEKGCERRAEKEIINE
jgi:hypothetical protein